MVKACFHNTRIKGISVAVPAMEKILTDDKELYSGDQRRIKRVIESSGFLKRRVADEETTTADLCFQAAERLLENTHTDKAEIDALVFSSYTPDFLMPATSYVLHDRLGLSENCVVMDIPQACSGYLLGLYQAAMLLNGGCKKVLLLVGDAFSKFSDMFRNHTAPVFGDAGSATLLERDENAEPFFFDIRSCGKNYDALMCINGGFRNPPKPDMFYEDGSFKYEASMDGGRIFSFTLEEVAPCISDLMAFAQTKEADIDYFVMHQANKFILENIAELLHVDVSKMPMTTLTEYGNQCGASIPCCIADKLSSEVQNKKLTLLLSGFGVGLSWASALIKTDNLYCSGVCDYAREK